jgi:hypothetical protein
MRSPFAAGACALAVIVLAACGGGSSQPSNQTIRGSGNEFLFQAPYSWHVRRRDSQVQAVPKPVSPELVSVSVFPLLHPYKPSLFAAATRELDADARQLATRLGGTVKQAATVTLGGIKGRQYELAYESGGHDFHQRITFVLRGKTEFQLLCRWTGDEPSACGQLEKTFRPL